MVAVTYFPILHHIVDYIEIIEIIQRHLENRVPLKPVIGDVNNFVTLQMYTNGLQVTTRKNAL